MSGWISRRWIEAVRGIVDGKGKRSKGKKVCV